MENLQKLMPYFQDQLAQWYQLTLEKPDYAAAVAISVWLLIAIFYSIRIAFIKKDITRLTKANAGIQAELAEAKEKAESAQQQLAEVNLQLQSAEQAAESEKQRGESLEQRLAASNQELAASLAKLVESFELSLHNLPAADSDQLISENQSVIERVSERFKNEQQAKTQLQLSFHAESAKLAEKEMLITSLQHRLDSQTQQLAQMELAIEQYEAAQRQLQVDREQQLAQAMAKQQAQLEAAKVAESKAKQQETKFAQAAFAAAEQAGAAVKPMEKTAEAAPVAPAPKAEAAKVAVEKKAEESEGVKFKGLFGKAMEKFASMDQKLGSSSEAKPSAESQAAAEVAKPAEPEPVETVQAEPKAEQKKPSGVGSKMSGLFGGFKKSKAKEAVADKPTEVVETLVEESRDDAEKKAGGDESGKSGKKMQSQLSGLFGKLKKNK